MAAPGDFLFLSREFPSVEIALSEKVPTEPHATIFASEWSASPFTPEPLDMRLVRAEEIPSFHLRLVLDMARCRELTFPGIAFAILTRYQRYMDHRNEASSGPLFAKILECHRALHTLEKPLVRADYEHALDTWQWTLRLSPEASFPVQVAALFHDIERLVSEADVRIEQHAADYQAFKNAHAKNGAAFARKLLSFLGVPKEDLARIQQLIEEHEQPGEDPELSLLNDADALSFFSLNSMGFLRYYGPAHTRRKVLYSLRRLRPETLPWLSQIRHPDAIVTILAETLSGFAATWRL